MNNLRNKVHLIGRLGKDPEVFTFDNGKVKASVSLATNESYKNQQGEQVTEAQWHNIVAWGKTAELVGKLCKKGKEVAIDGKLSSRKFKDKEGNNRSITEVIINEFLLLDREKEQ
jgi:single-strand DNA-binding protein